MAKCDRQNKPKIAEILNRNTVKDLAQQIALPNFLSKKRQRQKIKKQINKTRCFAWHFSNSFHTHLVNVSVAIVACYSAFLLLFCLFLFLVISQLKIVLHREGSNGNKRERTN